MKKCLMLFLALMAISFVQTSKADAAVFADWYFVNSGSTFTPGAQIVMWARLVNIGIATDGNFTRAYFRGASADSDPSPAGTYGVFKFGPSGSDRLWDQFDDINLRPGESFDFVFGTRLPSGPTPEGKYIAKNNSIGFRMWSNTNSAGYYTISRDFSWSVGVPPVEPPIDPPQTPVPEPATMVLFGIGGIATAFLKRKKILS